MLACLPCLSILFDFGFPSQGYSLGLVVADSWTHLEIALIYNALLVDLGFSAVYSHQARAVPCFTLPTLCRPALAII